MVVFHVITHLNLSGGERVAINIAKNGSREYEHHIVGVIGAKGVFYEGLVKELNDADVIYHQGPSVGNKLGILLFPFWFIPLVVKWRPVVLHSHTEVPDLSVFLFHIFGGWLFRGIKYVRTIHNTVLWTGWPGVGKIVERFFMRKSSNVAICISVQKSYYKYYGELPPIIYNGLEPFVAKPFPNLDGSKVNILFAGRLEWQKGVDEMLSVVRHYSGDDRFAFYIIGDGSMRLKVLEQIGVQDNVRIRNAVNNISSYLGSFDYLFMPSNHEGLPLLSIEAAMAGTPPIINDCDGLNETVPKDWPLKVRGNNVEDYIRIFDGIDNLNREKLGVKARSYVEKRFSAKDMSKAYEKFYG